MIRPAAIVLGIAALAAAAGPAVAAAPTPGGVLVSRVTVDGAPAGQTLLTQQELVAAEDLDGRLVSAAALVQLARVPLERLATLGVRYVGRPGEIRLPPEEVAAGDAAFDPEYNAQDVRFRRGAEEIAPATGTRLLVTLVTTGPVLHVAADADRTQVEPGASVHLTASAPDAPPGTTYSWSFGDDAYEEAGAATEADHVFAADGVYPVTVTAQAPNGSAGVSGPVPMHVGTASAAQPPGGDGATTAPPPPSPEAAGGGTGDRRAPASGPDDGTGTDAHAHRGAHRARAARTGPAAGAETAAASTSPGPAPAPDEPSLPAGATRPSSMRHRPGPVPRPDAGGTVRGLVLVGFHGAPLTAAAPPAPETTPQDQAAARAASGDGATGDAWLLLPALLALLGLGAARELARRDRPLGPA